MSKKLNTFATGTSGTIGKHLSGQAIDLKIDLELNVQRQELPSRLDSANLIHLAGIVGNAAVENDKEKSFAVNVRGTIQLAEAFRNQGEGIFYFVSTSHVYAPNRERINEDAEVGPVTRYAEQKLTAENELRNLFSAAPHRLCIIRVFSVLDWDVGPFTLGGGIRKLAMNDPNFELKCGEDIRDFLTPKSIAQAILQISKNNLGGCIFNLSSGIGTSVGDAARRMLAESHFEIPESRILHGNSSSPFVVGDSSKLQARLPGLSLDWRPSTLR